MREHVGDYQRQLFLIDHAGLPLKTVLEQIDILAEDIVPVLRRENESKRPAHVPSDPPSHAERVLRARANGAALQEHVAGEDRFTGNTTEQDAADARTEVRTDERTPARAGASFGL